MKKGGIAMTKPTFEELQQRIEKARVHDDYDDRHACCWQGYLAALLEWDLITPNDHANLAKEVPVKEPDPSLRIFLG
jgi:hypothetical protein